MKDYSYAIEGLKVRATEPESMKEVLRMYGDPEKWVKMSARNLALNKKQVRES